MWPHRRQPTRHPRPWDSLGKKTGVSCHFLLQCMKVKSESEVAQSCPTLSNPMDCSLPGSSVHGVFQGRGLEWAAIAFSESNLGLPHCRQILYWLSHPDNLRDSLSKPQVCDMWMKSYFTKDIFPTVNCNLYLDFRSLWESDQNSLSPPSKNAYRHIHRLFKCKFKESSNVG